MMCTYNCARRNLELAEGKVNDNQAMTGDGAVGMEVHGRLRSRLKLLQLFDFQLPHRHLLIGQVALGVL